MKIGVAWNRWFAFVVIFLRTTAYANDSEERVCEIEGTCDQTVTNTCEDVDAECGLWAEQGLCDENAAYMLHFCAKSCNSCGTEQSDPFPQDGHDEYEEYHDEDEEEDDVEARDEYGVIQAMDGEHLVAIQKAIEDMKTYIHGIREDPETTPKMHEIINHCKNQHESCAFWAVLGECEANPSYMKKDCAPMCQTCEYLSMEFRCPIDPDAPVAWKPGDLNTFFLNITTLPELAKYEPHVLSRPDYIDGETNETADYKIGPWVVVLDNFISDEEAERLIQLGAEKGYERSMDVGELKFDGTFDDVVDEGRTSLNAWCEDACYEDPLAKQVMARIEEITNIPETNSEHLQLLQYEVSQFYNQHHDYIEYDIDRQSGVRILTVFLYLNEVEAGGGTSFPFLNITVMPKKGRALIWPSVLDESPDHKDDRTEHEALPVEKGIKYGANAWLHQRDYKGVEPGCN